MKRFNLLLFILLLILLCGCGKSQGDEAGEEDQEPAPVIYYNPVTHLPVAEADIRVRPVAIMINNVKKGTPQEGISQADIYFELPAEGDTNRIMAVFYDYGNITSIGTVRSARDYFVDYARSLDALYLHYGGSPQFYTLRSQLGYDSLDGINSDVEKHLYWRDAERRKKNGREHSVMTSGEKITATITALNRRAELERDYYPYFHFTEESAPTGELAATTVTIPFSSYISPVFHFDPESGLYVRMQYGKEHMDVAYNEQLAVKNLVVLKTDVRRISGDESLRVDVKTTGKGKGYYITDGNAREIIWEKESALSRLKLCDLYGNEIEINSGKMWVSILASDPLIEPGVIEATNDADLE